MDQLKPPLAETTLWGMGIASGAELRHFLNALRSPRSFWHVTGLVLRYWRDGLLHGRGMRLVNGNALVGALALAMSEKRKRPIEPELVLKLAGQVLDVFLDPNCHECDGTGKSGSAYLGEVERQCRVCKGVGHRRDIIGRGVSEVTFAAVLLGELQRQVSAAARGMVVALSAEQRIHSEADATDDLQAVLEQLARRLADLRSEEADRDDVVEKLPADDIAAPES